MDSITVIAIASIITAGLTTGIGCMLPAFSEGKAGAPLWNQSRNNRTLRQRSRELYLWDWP